MLQRRADELLAAHLREAAEPHIVTDGRRELVAQLAIARTRLDAAAALR